MTLQLRRNARRFVELTPPGRDFALKGTDACTALQSNPDGYVDPMPARDEDDWVATLVREDGVVVHPGYFFDLEREGSLVVSLLPEPAVFEEGISRLVGRVS